MEDTPPKQMRARSGEHDIVYYRLDELRSDVRDIARKLDSFIDHARDQESDSIRAIERCGRHDEQLKVLHDQVVPAIHRRIDEVVVSPDGEAKRDPLTFWTAIGAACAGAGALLNSLLGGGK